MAVFGAFSPVAWPLPARALLLERGNEFFLELATGQAVDVGVDRFV